MSSTANSVENELNNACTDPTQVEDTDYVAWAYRDIRPEFAEHLKDCAYCHAQATAYSEFDRKLGENMWFATASKFKAHPPTQQIGHYILKLLKGEQKKAIKAHLEKCESCHKEYAWMKEWLSHPALEPIKPESKPLMPRLIAALLGQGSNAVLAAGLRSNADSKEAGAPQIYQAEEISVNITIQPSGPRKPEYKVLGLLQRNHSPIADSDEDIEVRLLEGDTLLATEEVDDLGYFEFENVAPAQVYNLEITLSDKIVIIPGIVAR